MLKNYFSTAWRNLIKNKAHSLINVAGLSIGMAVAMLIGLWIYEELGFNKGFDHYDSIAQVMQHQTFNADVGTQYSLPYLMGDELRKDYGSDFKYISMSSWNNRHIIASDGKMITSAGSFMEPQITEMRSLKRIRGTRAALDAGDFRMEQRGLDQRI